MSEGFIEALHHGKNTTAKRIYTLFKSDISIFLLQKKLGSADKT
jgi:hypothetical protein